MSSRLVFTRERRDEFWRRIEEVLADFPETTAGLSKSYDPEERDHSSDWQNDLASLLGEFDPESPVMVQGMVLLVSCRNMQGYETMFLSNPTEQSDYMSDGMIANAFTDI